MINRAYLPYQSARRYTDRGMAKWMGFFISEHSTALSNENERIDFGPGMGEEEKLFLLGQAYLNQTRIAIALIDSKELYIGTVYEIAGQEIIFNTESTMPRFAIHEIRSIALAEDKEDEL